MLPHDFEGVIFSGLSQSYPSIDGAFSLKKSRFEFGCCPAPKLPEMRQLSMSRQSCGSKDRSDAEWDRVDAADVEHMLFGEAAVGARSSTDMLVHDRGCGASVVTGEPRTSTCGRARSGGDAELELDDEGTRVFGPGG